MHACCPLWVMQLFCHPKLIIGVHSTMHFDHAPQLRSQLLLVIQLLAADSMNLGITLHESGHLVSVPTSTTQFTLTTTHSEWYITVPYTN